MSYTSRKRHYSNYSTNPKDYSPYPDYRHSDRHDADLKSPRHSDRLDDLKSPTRSVKSIIVKSESKDNLDQTDSNKSQNFHGKFGNKWDYLDRWMRVTRDDFGQERLGKLHFASVRKNDVVLVAPCFHPSCHCVQYAPNRTFVTVETISGYRLVSVLKIGNFTKTFIRTIWPETIWKKVNTSQLLLPQHQSTYPRGPESASIENPLSDLTS